MKKVFLSTLLLLTFLVCCENTDNPTITGTVPGNIIGYLKINESNDFSGATVSLKGTAHKTLTDKNGKWLLENIEPGVYDIIFSKLGYDTTELYGFPFPGNGTAYCNGLHHCGVVSPLDDFSGGWVIFKTNDNKISDFKADSDFKIDSVWDTNYDSTKYLMNVDTVLNIYGKLSKIEYNIYFFINESHNPSIYSYDYYFHSEGQDLNIDEQNLTFQIKLNKHWFNYRNYKTGDKIFIRAYPGGKIVETDLRTNQKRWIGFGTPSEVLELVIPQW